MQSLKESLHFVFRGQPLLLDLLARHAGRVDKFGVVVIAQQISQVLGRWFSGIDVGVRIDQSDRVEFVKERVLERIHDDSKSAINRR